MVEPAIAISAMNIATLRPLFKSFFKTFSKVFDPATDSEGSIGPLGDLKMELISQNSVQASEYTAEFAQLLGLSRVGVTTEISAGTNEKQPRKRRFTLRQTTSRISDNDFGSQTELKGVNSPSFSDGDWAMGITATTTIVQEVK